MNKKIIIVIVILFIANTTKAQTGWFIIEKGTKYKVYQRSYLDYYENGNYISYDSLTIGLGEVVFKWGQTQDYFIVSEISGRISFIDKREKITLTEVDRAGDVAYLNIAYTLTDGHVIGAGSALWIYSVNEKLNTCNALVYGGLAVKLSLEDLNFVTVNMEKNINANNKLNFKTVK